MLGKIKHQIIDLYRGTHVVDDYRQIKNEVNKGWDHLQQLQQAKLVELLLHVKQHVPYYAALLHKTSEAEINRHPYEILKGLPIISKEDFLSDTVNFKSVKPPAHVPNHTGGSTGSPLTYLVDINCVSRTRAFDLYWWNQAFGYSFGDKVLTIGGSSIGNSKNMQLKIYNYLQSKKFLEGGNISAEILDKNTSLICKGNYDIIYAYPSALMLYVETAKAKKMHFNGKLKGITTTSENLTTAVRLSIEDFFNAPVYDVYGARDGGIVADECRNKSGLHYNFQDCYVEEFYESNSNDVPELVLTNLISYAQPMIRYRVGDLGRLSGETCSCGNPLPRIIDFSGRTRDLLTLTNGRVIHGSLFNKIVSYYPNIKQFQTIYSQNQLKFIMTVSSSLAEEKEIEFISKIKDLTGVKEILIDYSGNFEYTEAGKLKTVLTK